MFRVPSFMILTHSILKYFSLFFSSKHFSLYFFSPTDLANTAEVNQNELTSGLANIGVVMMSLFPNNPLIRTTINLLDPSNQLINLLEGMNHIRVLPQSRFVFTTNFGRPPTLIPHPNPSTQNPPDR